MKLFDELKYRGLINDVTSPQLEEKLNNGGLTSISEPIRPVIPCISDTTPLCCVQND